MSLPIPLPDWTASLSVTRQIKLVHYVKACCHLLQNEIKQLAQHAQEQKERAIKAERTNGDRRIEIARLQARIDALMLEHCPDEMTQEQRANWGQHQIPASERYTTEGGDRDERLRTTD